MNKRLKRLLPIAYNEQLHGRFNFLNFEDCKFSLLFYICNLDHIKDTILQNLIAKFITFAIPFDARLY